jgi:hypothetical protein
MKVVRTKFYDKNHAKKVSDNRQPNSQNTRMEFLEIVAAWQHQGDRRKGATISV